MNSEPAVPGVVESTEWTDERLGSWRFSRADPSPSLTGLVREYWEVRGDLSEFREKLLPNGGVEVMFNLGPPHRVLSEQGRQVWDHSWLSGLQSRSIEIESLQGTHLLSARLHPLGAYHLFGDAVPRAVDRVIELSVLLGEQADTLRRALLHTVDPSERFAALDAFLLSRRPDVDPVPAFVRSATTAIERTHGVVAIGSIHASLGVSRKHLSMSMTRYLGMSAKSYAQVQRFCWALDRLKSNVDVDWSRLAYDAGYSDHSHLVRDFQRVGAATPTTYLRARTPDGTAIVHG